MKINRENRFSVIFIIEDKNNALLNTNEKEKLRTNRLGLFLVRAFVLLCVFSIPGYIHCIHLFQKMLSAEDLKSVTERNCGPRALNSKLKESELFSSL